MSGYSQAVENLAYAIHNVGEETLDPIITEHGVTTTDEAKPYMTAEDLAKWDDIETVSDVICSTYDVEYDQLMADVAVILMDYLMRDLTGGLH